MNYEVNLKVQAPLEIFGTEREISTFDGGTNKGKSADSHFFQKLGIWALRAPVQIDRVYAYTHNELVHVYCTQTGQCSPPFDSIQIDLLGNGELRLKLNLNQLSLFFFSFFCVWNKSHVGYQSCGESPRQYYPREEYL